MPFPQINPALLNPHFRGYKMAPDPPFAVSVHAHHRDIFQGDFDAAAGDFQLNADACLASYLAHAPDCLVFIAKDQRHVLLWDKDKDALSQCIPFPGPISSAVLLESIGLVAVQADGPLVFSSPGSFPIDTLVETGAFRILGACDAEPPCLLVQQVVDAEKFTLATNRKHRHVFIFYLVNAASRTSTALAWSWTRPVFSSLSSQNICIATPSGLNCIISRAKDACEPSVQPPPTDIVLPDAPAAACDSAQNVIADALYDDEFEDNRDLNSCFVVLFDMQTLKQQDVGEVSWIGPSIFDESVVISHGVDAVQFSLGSFEHTSTFPAIAYIQSGKADRRFTLFTAQHAFIVDRKRLVYAYEQSRSATARQYLLPLPSDCGCIAGYSFDKKRKCIYLLTSSAVVKIAEAAGA